jgi:hypothetical protein
VAHYDIAVQVHDERTTGAPRPLNQFLGMLERVQIGAADSTGQGFDKYFAGTGHGRGDISDDDLLATHHGSTHAVSSEY